MCFLQPIHSHAVLSIAPNNFKTKITFALTLLTATFVNQLQLSIARSITSDYSLYCSAPKNLGCFLKSCKKPVTVCVVHGHRYSFQ